MHFVVDNICLKREVSQHITGFIFNLAFKRLQDDDITHVELVNWAFDRQRAGVFKRVEEDRGNLATNHKTALFLVRHVGDVVADCPEH